MAGLGRALDRGARIYWVCPLVEESDTIDFAAAETRFAELSARFPGQVGLAHGQMDPEVRERRSATSPPAAPASWWRPR